MLTRKRIQVISIGFLIIAVLLLLINTDWSSATSVWGFISLVCGTIGSIISVFIPSSKTLYFIEDDWNHERGSYFMLIEKAKHGIGNSPIISVFLKEDKHYVPIMIHDAHDDSGNIRLESSLKFSGKIVIS